MAFTVFYSWQSKTDPDLNHYFIRDCLKEAIKQIKKKTAVTIDLDHDTKDQSGIPLIPQILESKIKEADIFVADLSYIDYQEKNIAQRAWSGLEKFFGKKEEPKERASATNVSIELGFALGSNKITWERIITVMNTAYGQPDDLPFDIKQRSFPSTYELKPGSGKDEIKKQKEILVGKLVYSIMAIHKTELERQKEYFHPLMVFPHWGKTFSTAIKFENTDYIKTLFHEIRQHINEAKTVFRICGLSGVGKTRILFECFYHKADGVPEELTDKILYVDCNQNDEKSILISIRELLLRDECKIVIIDNCSIELHNAFTGLVTNTNSKLSLLTVGLNPDERIEQLDAERVTRLLKIDNIQCKETVRLILTNNFPELDPKEIDLLIDFSSGIAAVATLMAHNPDRANKQPGSLQRKDILNRLLGNLYEDSHCRAIILASSLFSKFGFFDDLSGQADMIATNVDITPIHWPDANPEDLHELKINKFREVCKIMDERKLLEQVGRMYSLRPSPLAITMAEEWWKSCTTQKFVRILPELHKHGLVEQFCEQFQYLKHLDHAKAIVGDLCSGVFSSAEVLNTKAGSRLFRSFVNVNPLACIMALNTAFIELEKEQIEKIDQGRRNLVWALEKLCFRPETFIPAAKIMALFSLGENEGIGNNATNQFLQLFHILLPGTAANLERRWEIIEFCLADLQYVDLGIKALNRGLTAHNFHRMGGAEDQGDSSPLKDYHPDRSEIFTYWNKIVNKLLELSGQDEYKVTAANILFENFYALCAADAGSIIIPAIYDVASRDLLDKMELRSKLKFVINSNRIFNKDVLHQLETKYAELAPVTFDEKFKTLVQNPSSDEYFPKDDDPGDGKKLLEKITQLSGEFYAQKDNWGNIAPNLVRGQISEVFNFGNEVGKQINEAQDGEVLVDIIIKQLTVTPAEERNFNFLLGLLTGLNNLSLSVSVFNRILNDAEMKNNAFLVARSLELPYEEIKKCVDGLEKGYFDIQVFSTFDYGWGLRHLPFESALELLERIRRFSDAARIVVYHIISKWSHSEKGMRPLFAPLMREMIVNDSSLILENARNTMDSFQWSVDILKLLEDSSNTDIAKKAIDTIIEISNLSDGYYSRESNFYKIIDVLQEKYFDIFWAAISDFFADPKGKGYSLFHLKDMLGPVHDYSGSSDGLLFKGDIRKFETIFNWCKNQPEDIVHWIALMVPVYQTKVAETEDWHPYALAFINEFGKSEGILSAISASMGTYSWTGSIVPRLDTELKLFRLLENHPIPEVRKWAEIHITDISSRILWEGNREKDGFIGGINY